MPTLLRPALTSLLVTLLLAGCADKPTRHTGSTAPRSSSTSSLQETGAHPSESSTSQRARHHSSPRQSTSDEKLPDNTGIPACDDYLASYRACHRAAKIYAPGIIEQRYQLMRTSLLKDSLDPNIRPQLSERCNALAESLRTALHGKACIPDPAESGTAATPSH